MKLRKWINLISGVIRYRLRGRNIINIHLLVVDDEGYNTTWDTIWVE
jgi:hypothetical protein